MITVGSLSRDDAARAFPFLAARFREGVTRSRISLIAIQTSSSGFFPTDVSSTLATPIDRIFRVGTNTFLTMNPTTADFSGAASRPMATINSSSCTATRTL
jgi:hypothetical protein